MRGTCGTHRWMLAGATIVVAMAAALIGGSEARAADALHGISLSKGCDAQTKIGDPYLCSYTVQNLATVDTALDTLTVAGLSDTVISGLGNVSSGPLLTTLQLVSSGGATCTGPTMTGNGSAATPYVGATSCDLPTGSSIQSVRAGWYTVQPTDYNQADPFLDDRVLLDWRDQCNGGASNCSTRAQQNTAGASTQIVKRDSKTDTTIHDASHSAVTSVPSGSTVHDLVTVTGDPGKAIPSGNVLLKWFTNDACTGDAADSTTLALDATGKLHAESFAKGPLASGAFAFRAIYAGDGTYNGSTGPCEPLSVISKLPSTTVTDIHNGSHVVIADAQPGDIVHDKATVTGTGPTPTGTVDFTVYLGNTSCTGPGTSAGTAALVNGVADPSGNVTVPDGGLSFKAHYNGDGNYTASDGACEPLATALACPAGGFTGSLNPTTGNFTIVYDQFPAPNDNSYGVNAVGWGTKGHSFGDLTGSDKSGYEVVNPAGTVVLDFYIDYLSSTTPSATFPSGYRSLGPFGGDGRVNVGTLTASDLSWDTSLSRNLNNLGYFSLVGTTPTQRADTLLAANNGTNLLVNSPATLNTTDSYTLKTPNHWDGTITYAENGRTVNGWDFHDTFFVTLNQAKLLALGAIEQVGGQWQLKAGWKIQPDLTGLHNSPAKACPAAPPGPAELSITKKVVNKQQVQITILNSGGSDAVLTQLQLAWPQAINGNLTSIKFDGDVLWSNSTGLASPQTLGVPPLVSTATKRTIAKGTSDVLNLIFKNNADPDLSHYSGTASWANGTPDLTILP